MVDVSDVADVSDVEYVDDGADVVGQARSAVKWWRRGETGRRPGDICKPRHAARRVAWWGCGEFRLTASS